MILLAFILIALGFVIGGISILQSTREVLSYGPDTQKLLRSSFQVLSDQQEILIQTESTYAQSYCKDIQALESDLTESDNQMAISTIMWITIIIFFYEAISTRGKRDIAS
jgi:predicted PurR-regulated permease PerM